MHTLLRMPRVLWAIFVLAAVTTSASATQFLRFPLSSSLYPSGAYTSGKITSLLDHSMVANGSGKYQYGDPSIGGYDNQIVGFTGQFVGGGTLFGYPSGTTQVCLSGTISLGGLMASPAGCGPNAASYNEHPGYDYQADYNTPVYAAFAGYVVNNGSTGRCVMTSTTGATCDSWGMVGIDHSSAQPPFVAQPYITQYEHLSSIVVSAGQYVIQGQLIGYSGHTAPVAVGNHLHFEVIRLKPNASNNYVAANYAVIDPYGWTSTVYNDPLYSAQIFTPTVTNQRLWQ